MGPVKIDLGLHTMSRSWTPAIFPSFAVPVALALTDCVWSTDECLTAVYQYESYWTMYITCTDGSGGTWTGSGQWGGISPE